MHLSMRRGQIFIKEAPKGFDASEFDASYHKGWKCWILPASHESVKKLDKIATLPPEIDGWLKEQEQLEVQRERANRVKGRSAKKIRAWLETKGVSFKGTPFNHQIVTIAYGLLLRACGLFLDTGCGKTYVAAHIIQALFDTKGLKRVLVIAPKTILNTGWGDDLDEFSDLKWVNISRPPRRPEVLSCSNCGRTFKKHISWSHIKTHLKPSFLAKDDAKERFYARFPDLKPVGQDSREELVRRALKSDNQVFLINPEAFKICIDVLMEAEWDMMIVDESSMLKSPKSKITKSTIAFGAGVPRRICMTATPRPNSSLDLWGQMAFLDTCLGGNFYDFRRRFYYKGYDGFSWAPKDSSVDMMIRDIIFDRSIRYRLDDCVDLPGENYQYIEVELEGELRAHYDDMHRRMMVQLKDDTVETSFLIVQINKLAQITSGFIFDDLGQAQFLGNSPKIEATLQTARQMLDVEERGVVIWIRFREEARILEEALKKYGVSTMHGGTRDSEASARAFKDGKTRVMIAHAASAKFGHTWVKHCNAAIFHSYDYSWENFYQAKRRIYRIGQKEKVTYFPVIAKGTVDEQIIEAVMRKEADSDSVIDSNFIDRLKDLKRG